jgi:Domain of unknown function (DUF4129)
VKPDGIRLPVVAVLTGLGCVIIAVGAGLEGRFTFAGPLGNRPGFEEQPLLPAPTDAPQPTVTPSPLLFSAGGNGTTWATVAVLLVILALAALLVILLLLVRKRRRLRALRGPVMDVTDSDELLLEHDALPDLPTLKRGLGLASDVLETDRTPSDAIVQAWVGLQEAAEDSGVRRRQSETPTEFTARVFSSIPADRNAADTLLALYLRVRFGSAPANSRDLRSAKDAVGALQASWPDGGAP